MTHFNIYCDESRHTSDPSQRFLVIGALQCPRDEKRQLVHDIHVLMARHNAHGELGWKRLSPNREEFYWGLLDLFVRNDDLRFRALVADRNRLNHELYNAGDAELGFYKLYYQLLVHWLEPGNTYSIYLDWQQNREQHRFKDLHAVLTNKLRGRSAIHCLEPVTSENVPLIGLCDLFIGAVGYVWNGLQGSQTKLKFCDDLAQAAGLRSIGSSTPKSEAKFNIFHFEGR
jgi:hypothetical protein